MEKFNKNELHSGYLIETRDGTRFIVARVNQKNFTKILHNSHHWNYLSSWNDDGTYKSRYIKQDGRIIERASDYFDIMKVYGLTESTNNYYLNGDIFDAEHRPLLWERRPTMRLTMPELCELLKADVEIVSED